MPSLRTVSVRRGSTTTTGTPRRFASRTRARHSQPMMQSSRFAPQSTIIPACGAVEASMPVSWVPSTARSAKRIVAELYESHSPTWPPKRFRKRAVRLPVLCRAPRHEPEPPSA